MTQKYWATVYRNIFVCWYFCEQNSVIRVVHSAC